jgi:hypothetical protein
MADQAKAVAAAVRAAALALERLAARIDTAEEADRPGGVDSESGWEAVLIENSQLREALDSRAVIERAKGMLMVRHGCSEQEAFTMLAAAARRQHRKVRLVASDLSIGDWTAFTATPTA